MFTVNIPFKDCCVRIKELNISYTYRDWLEGPLSWASKIVLEKEKENVKNIDGFLFLEPSLPDGARLGNYRFELRVDSATDEYYYYNLTLVFFEDIQGVNLQEVVISKTKHINFKDIAQKISWKEF